MSNAVYTQRYRNTSSQLAIVAFGGGTKEPRVLGSADGWGQAEAIVDAALAPHGGSIDSSPWYMIATLEPGENKSVELQQATPGLSQATVDEFWAQFA